MASSLYDTYGKVSVKNVFMDESGFKLFNANDDTKFCEVKANAPSGQHTHTLPNTTGALLNDQSSLSAAKVDINAATSVDALANEDSFLLYDNSATANRKVALSALASFVGGSGVPAGTAGELLIYDAGNAAASTALSGDVTVNASGVAAIGANKVTNSMLAGSIEYNKLSLNNAVTSNDLAGSIAYNKLSLNNSVTNADLAGSIENSKVSALAGVSAGTASASRALVLNAQSEITGIDTVGLNVVNFGGDQWRIKLDAGNIVMQFKDGPTWVTKHIFSSA